MKHKPRYCYSGPCPIARKTTGFAMPDSLEKVRSGARLFFWLEAAGSMEADQSLPLVGATGIKVWEYLTPPDLDRSKVILDNTLRCHPTKNEYPIERQRVEAEAACRHYDYLLYEFNPTIFGVTFHPGSLRKAPNTTEFVIRDIAHAWELAKSGERVLLAMGAKALHALMPELPESLKKMHGCFWPVSLPAPSNLVEIQNSAQEISNWQAGEEADVDYYDSQGFWKPF